VEHGCCIKQSETGSFKQKLYDIVFTFVLAVDRSGAPIPKLAKFYILACLMLI